MIRYATLPGGMAITLESLRAAVEADAAAHADAEIRRQLKNWLKKADDRTVQLLAAKAYIDRDKWSKLNAADRAAIPEPIAVTWSSIKHLFILI